MPTTVEQLLARKGHEYYSVHPDAKVSEAVSAFSMLNIGALLVCEKSELLGVLSERDVVRRVLARGLDPERTLVREVMTARPICVTPSDGVERCMSIMNDARIRHLPVVHYSRIVGVISMGDVIHSALTEREQMIEELEGYISGSPSVRPPSPSH